MPTSTEARPGLLEVRTTVVQVSRRAGLFRKGRLAPYLDTFATK